jgi:biotin carboxyl carrier protein
MIVRLKRGRSIHVVELDESADRPAVRIDGVALDADFVRLADGAWSVLSGGRSIEVSVARAGEKWRAESSGRRYLLQGEGAALGEAAAHACAGGPHEVRATLPGKIVRVEVETGARVEEGAGLVVIEAMKMENELRSPFEARVASVAVTAGQTVETGALLLVLEPLSEPAGEPEE